MSHLPCRPETLGIYVSVPFCQAKCSFCNFASGVHAAGMMDGYVERVLMELRQARGWAERVGAELPGSVDTVYFGGGTPSLLPPELIERLFSALRAEFPVAAEAEITVECAPLQLVDESLAAFQEMGVNRLSFGVQSFVDREAAAVGRMHTGQQTLIELDRVRRAGVTRVGIDLICGLPHQTEASWGESLEQAVQSGVEHVSMYMLEVDEDSRLGAEALASGNRFGAAALPDDDAVADWYAAGCERLGSADVGQYEISNFARDGGQSRHNRRYWERRPYLGFGLDAHSMLRAQTGAVRWANVDEMRRYMDGLAGLGSAIPAWQRTVDRVDQRGAFEEAMFLGLRLVEGVDLAAIRREFGPRLIAEIDGELTGLAEDGLLMRQEGRVRLTGRGREVSNEVFGRLMLAPLEGAVSI